MNKGMILFFVLVLTFGIVSGLHSASDVIVEVDGVNRSLEYMRDNDIFGTFFSYEDPSGVTRSGYHFPSNIWVSMYDTERTLLQAIGMGAIYGGSDTYFNYDLSFGHSATEIIFDSDGRSLQWVITNHGFCTPETTCQPGWCEFRDDGCGDTFDCGACTVGVCNSNNVCQGVCAPPQTEVKDCDYLEASYPNRNYEDVIKTCQSDGSWNDPACNIYYFWNDDGWKCSPSYIPSGNSCAATAMRNVWCQKSDGTTVEDNKCPGTKPTTNNGPCGCRWWELIGDGYCAYLGFGSNPDRLCSETNGVSCTVVMEHERCYDPANDHLCNSFFGGKYHHHQYCTGPHLP